MNRTARTLLAKVARATALALAAPLLAGAGAAFAQPYANDGGVQNAGGSWDVSINYCRQDPNGLGSSSRNACRSVILSAGTGAEPGNTYYNPLFDSQTECTANNPGGTPPLPGEWTAGPNCTNYFYNASQAICEAGGGMWLTNICRGAWMWVPTPPLNTEAGYRNNCTRCHNSRYSNGSEWGNGESYLLTGHKNMARPVVNANTQYYTVGYPWSGADGTPYPSDGTNPINWAAGTINVGGSDTELYWIYDGWIGEFPRAIYAAGSNATTGKPLMSYSCGRCHTTGWTSDATIQTTREPELTFPGVTWDGTTLNTTGKVNLAGAVTGDTNKYSSWDVWGISCSRCHGSKVATGSPDPRHHPNIPGKEATGSTATGATRVALCMDCHRQENGGLPYDNGATPGTVLKVGPAHNSVEFLSHWAGNLFLNSPHGRFTGTFAQINDKTLYDTHFKTHGESYPPPGNQGGCTQCHNVHKSTSKIANPAGEAIHEECTLCHAKDLDRLRHPQGRGTPIDPNADPAEACVTCHMPENLHLFRITTDPGYTMFPLAAMTGTANANTADEEGFPAVWVDMDHACGQCHGGGSGHVDTTGTIAAGSAALTVANGAGFVAGERVEVAGANAGGADFETYVAAVAGNTITLAGKATVGVTDAEVAFNPVANGAGYMTRAELAELARGMHDDKPIASFGYRLGVPDTLTINVDASGSVCPTVCNAYSWNWGDGTANGSGVTASHTYAAEGSYTITLTVTEYAVGSGSVSRIIKVYAPDYPPVVDGTCTFDANTWTETVTDASTDTPPGFIRQVTVNWGDGSMLSSDLTPPFGPFNHVYMNPGTFTLTHKAIDNVGQQASRTCIANPAYFLVGGNVYRSDGTTPVPTAMVRIRKAGTTTILRTVYTNALGAFTIGSLKPANYELLVSKTGYVFATPAATVTVGPSNTTVVILATTPLGGGVLSGRSIH